MGRYHPSVRCSASRTNGEPCGKYAIRGATVCETHGGNAPQVRARAAVRYDLESWRLGQATDDPGETLLRLLTQSRMRADLYADELERLVAESPNLRDALVGETWISTDESTYKAGEYVRGLAQLEAQERDRCANFARLALAAGLAERQVRLAERQVELFSQALNAALTSSGITGSNAAEVKRSVAQHLRLAIAAG